ncbi:MAG: SAM-dependent methyltransferase, partial [Oscillospiraceae bacterium]
MMGTVILVGAGPGDPGLLTVKGREAILQAEVVVYDRLVSEGVLALIPPSAEAIDVGKQAANHKVPQEGINKLLLEKALEGKRVVRLKGGDPFLF